MPEEHMNIIIRAMEPEDIDAISNIMNMPQARAGTLQVPFTSRAYRRQRMGEPNKPDQRVTLVAEVDSVIVGQASLYIRDRRERHSAGVGIAVHDEWQGRGIGTALMRALLDVADNWLGLTRVDLQVYTDNTPAIALYKKLGFEVEGTLRRVAIRAGCYVDAYAMARLHEGIPT